MGAIIFALEYYDPPFVKQAWMAGGILAVGVLNIIYYPFYWKHERKVQISKIQEVPLEPYPEEIIYGMDALYIKNNATVPAPGVVSPLAIKNMEGANESTDSKEGVTPGCPDIDIVVEPSAKVTTCSDEARQDTFIENTIPGKTIGVGAS